MQMTQSVRWLFWALLVGYALAAVAAVRFKDWGIGRYVPLISVLVVVVPSVLCLIPFFRRPLQDFGIIGLMAGLIFMGVTLRLAWSGRRLAERVLRVSSAAILAYFSYFILRGIP
jgi:hypothetical protein